MGLPTQTGRLARAARVHLADQRADFRRDAMSRRLVAPMRVKIGSPIVRSMGAMIASSLDARADEADGNMCLM